MELGHIKLLFGGVVFWYFSECLFFEKFVKKLVNDCFQKILFNKVISQKVT